jgi:hypothetical protein
MLQEKHLSKRVAGCERRTKDVRYFITPPAQTSQAIHGGAIIPDSSAIARYLAAAYPETAGKLFPTDPKQKNLAHVVSRMMEEALFPIALWYR